MKTLIFDVMLNEQYIHTFKYKYNPLFPIEEEELRKFVEERLPTLKGKKLKMIKKWYEVSCDLCGNGLNHYAELKPTCTDLRRDGFKVKINNGKVFVFCKECYEKIKKETKK